MSQNIKGDIYGQVYPSNAELDQAYIRKIAAYRDEKMSLISDAARAGDAESAGCGEKREGRKGWGWGGGGGGAELFFQWGEDRRGEMVDVRFRQGGCAAREHGAHQKGILSRRHIFAAEKIGGFDGDDF